MTLDFIGFSASLGPMKPVRAREHVADEVRALMARHRTNQEALAKVLGIHQTTLGTRLRGETAFDVDELTKLAAHFDVEVTELLPRDAA